MKTTANILSKIAYAISAVFLTFLTLSTFHYTFTHSLTDVTSELLYETPDSRLKNVLVILVIFILLILLSKLFFIKAKTKNSKNLRVIIFSASVSLTVFILLCIQISKSVIAPYWDQAMVYQSAAAVANKDYSSLSGVYYQAYPQQLGLIFFESIFLHITKSFTIFQYMNAFFIGLAIFMAGHFAKELTDSPEAEFFTVVFSAAFLPYYYYVSFVYGDIFAISMIFLTGWLIIKWMKNKKWYFAVPALIIVCIMVPVRENTLIFIIASIIVLIIHSIATKKVTPLIFALALFVLPVTSNKLITLHYEHVSGVTFSEEIPSINWIVMGMQGDLKEGTGVGYYNGYNMASWNMNGMSKEASTEYSKKIMSERIAEFKANPQYAISFFRYKLLEQWIEPTFDSVIMTLPYNDDESIRDVQAYSIENVTAVNRFMNYYLSVAYFFALFYTIYMFVKDRENHAILVSVLFIGIFLFSLMWEAKGRYSMPGFVILLSFTGCGIAKAGELSIYAKKLLKKK